MLRRLFNPPLRLLSNQRFISTVTTGVKTKVNNATLRVHGPDRKGIVASVSRILNYHGCDIAQSEQWTDTRNQLFFQRVEFTHNTENDTVSLQQQRLDIQQQLNEFCESLSLVCHLNWRERRPRVAVFVSKYDHCLWELLLRHKAQELECEMVAIISNHAVLRPVAETFKIPFHVFEISTENKMKQEQLELDLLASLRVDLIILARYMQVLSPYFLESFPNRVINIHHSFLPAFTGGRPYHQAHTRGVKLIGATAHYVTEQLDHGPIIEQDVLHISHRDTPEVMREKGRIIERNVLVRAVHAHLEDRVIPYQNKCVVFGD